MPLSRLASPAARRRDRANATESHGGEATALAPEQHQSSRASVAPRSSSSAGRCRRRNHFAETHGLDDEVVARIDDRDRMDILPERRRSSAA
jgi:hypothetical protein